MKHNLQPVMIWRFYFRPLSTRVHAHQWLAGLLLGAKRTCTCPPVAGGLLLGSKRPYTWPQAGLLSGTKRPCTCPPAAGRLTFGFTYWWARREAASYRHTYHTDTSQVYYRHTYHTGISKLYYRNTYHMDTKQLYYCISIYILMHKAGIFGICHFEKAEFLVLCYLYSGVTNRRAYTFIYFDIFFE